jgi:protocatechuate 3,4-dioxygenase, beta subunit
VTFMKKNSTLLAVGVLLASLALSPSESRADEPVVGRPCDGCEIVFQGRPAAPASDARIAAATEPGEPLVLEGTVRALTEKPQAGVVVYAYHTDARGIYPGRAEGSRHGRIRGWAQTGADGRYRFSTIRPAGYPGTTISQHIHMHVIEPGRCTYYIDEVVFEDDPRLTAGQRAAAARGRGGSGLVKPAREGAGWRARRDIVLGQDIPGYDQCVPGAPTPPAQPSR